MMEESTVNEGCSGRIPRYCLVVHCFVISSSTPPLPSILCKALQEDEICVVRAVEPIVMTKNSLDNIKTIPFEELPTVKMVMGWVKREDGFNELI